MAGSLPFRSAADRSAARSTTAGTPVRSWRTTRDGVNGSSTSGTSGCHDATFLNVFDGYRLPVDVAENGLEENADTDGELVEFTETLLSRTVRLAIW